jgi:hypothetical protein
VIEIDAAAAGTTGFRLVPTVGQQLTPVPTTHRSHTKRSPPRQKRPKTYGKTKPGGPAAALLLHVADPAAAARPEGRSSRTALRDLTILGAVTLDARDNVTLARSDLVKDGAETFSPPWCGKCLAQPMPLTLWSRALRPPHAVGAILQRSLGAQWSAASIVASGKYMRSWARLCGIETRRRPKAPPASELPIP